MIAAWPKADTKLISEKHERQFATLKHIVQQIRNARTENKIAPSQKIQAIIYAPDRLDLIKKHAPHLQRLAGLDLVTILKKGEKPHNALYLKVEDVEVYLPLGMMRVEEEKARLAKEVEQTRKLVVGVSQHMSDPTFIQKAPDHIVKNERQRLAEYQTRLLKLEEQLEKLTP